MADERDNWRVRVRTIRGVMGVCHLLVEPDGRAVTLTAGHLRVVEAAAPGRRRIAMRGLCCTLYPGQRLRLSLQAAAWPAFAVNPGTGSRPEAAAAMQAQAIVLALRHGAERPSRLLLPVLR